MSDEEPTVTVPVSLIDRAYEQSGDMVSESLGRIYEIAHPRRLRVVDLEAGRRHDYPDGHRWSFLGLEAAPDAMAIVEQEVMQWDHDYGVSVEWASDLLDRIRAALEQAMER